MMMLDIVINNQTFTYVNSARIDDKNYVSYTDGESVFISEFHYNDGVMIVSEIDEKTLLEVKEVLA